MDEDSKLTLEKVLIAKRMLDAAPMHSELILICPLCKTHITAIHIGCPCCGVKFYE